MPFSISAASSTLPNLFTISSNPHFYSQFNFISFPDANKNSRSSPKLAYSAAAAAAAAAKPPQSGPVKKRPPTPNSKKKKKPNDDNNNKGNNEKSISKRVEVVEDGESQNNYQALPLPKPPAGFVVDEQGRVLLASNKRIATIVSSFYSSVCVCVFFFPLFLRYNFFSRGAGGNIVFFCRPMSIL